MAGLILQVAISTAFLVGVVVQTSALKVKVLKSSALATLFALTAEDKAILERENPTLVEDSRVMAERLNTVTGKFGLAAEKGWALKLGGREELAR